MIVLGIKIIILIFVIISLLVVLITFAGLLFGIPFFSLFSVYMKYDENKDKLRSNEDLYKESIQIVSQYDRASASLLQRRLRIDYAGAVKILEQLESDGIVGLSEGAKPRKVLIKNAKDYLKTLKR